MSRSWVCFLVLMTACNGDSESEEQADGDGCTGPNMEWVDGECVPTAESDPETDSDDDGDGVLADDDCDDSDPALGAIAGDADCDGVLTDDDCDDSDSTLGAIAGDADCDGTLTDDDCDDDNAEIHPDASEVCDGLDNDCDGTVDNGVLETWYADNDGDGFGDAVSSIEDCEPPSGYTDDFNDCDDDDAEIHPDASETCDGLDNDCDGTVDNGVLETWYADSDGDGFGDAESSVEDCETPSGYTDDFNDCDDDDAEIHPDASETCDEVDNDCDGDIDEDDAIDASIWYADSDGDSYGDPDDSRYACDQASGYTADFRDCDDDDAEIHPDASETCDEVDNDCDGDTDEDDAIDPSIWYADSDGDGYGDPDVSTTACDAPSGFVEDDTDCNDFDAEQNPDSVWYVDADGDGYGDASISESGCEEPSGYVLNGDDCDDSDASFVRDVYYPDADGDGYGDADAGVTSCSEISGYLTDGTDCDDTDAAIHPGEIEVCGDWADNDCDGNLDTTPVEDDGVDSYSMEFFITALCRKGHGLYSSDSCTYTEEEIELESGESLSIVTGCDMSLNTGVTDVTVDLDLDAGGIISFLGYFDITDPSDPYTVTTDESLNHFDDGWMCDGTMYYEGYTSIYDSYAWGYIWEWEYGSADCMAEIYAYIEPF